MQTSEVIAKTLEVVEAPLDEPGARIAMDRKGFAAFPPISPQEHDLDAVLEGFAEALPRLEDPLQAARLALISGTQIERGAEASRLSEGLIARLTMGVAACRALFEAVGPAVDPWAVFEAHPEGARAWLGSAWLNMATMTTLCRDRAGRIRAREEAGLRADLAVMHGLLENGWYVNELLGTVDDLECVVLHPMAGLGWRVSLDAVRNNAHLFTLLEGALAETLGFEANEAMLECARARSWEFPSQRVLASLLFLEARGWRADGPGWPPAFAALDPEASPRDIPRRDGAAVIVVEDGDGSTGWPTRLISGLHEAHAPRVEVTGTLSAEALAEWIRACQ